MSPKVRYWSKLIRFTVIALLVAFYLVLPVSLAWIFTRPLRRPVEYPTGLGLALEDISVRTQDGLLLHGWYLPPQNGAVVLLYPGYGGDRRSTLGYAILLAEAGYGALMMDPRATGESEGSLRAYGWNDWADATALVDALLEHPEVNPDRLGAMGCSTGGEIALGAAALEPRISAVVSEAPFYATYSDISRPENLKGWLSIPLYPPFLESLKLFSGERPPLSLGEAAAVVAEQRPLLLIAGGMSDEGFEANQAQLFYAHTGGKATLWVIEEADHCDAPAVRPEEYRRRVLEFFDQAFGIP